MLLRKSTGALRGDLLDVTSIMCVPGRRIEERVIRSTFDKAPAQFKFPKACVNYFLGTVLQMDVNGLYVRHYDGIESVVPREETYLLTPEKFESDCAYILQCEERLVGQAVVARNEQDGMFHLGT